MKIGLLGHFLAALMFLLFLEPIAVLVGRILRAAPFFLVQMYQDRMYSELATGVPDFGFLMLAILFSVPGSATVGYLLSKAGHKHRDGGPPPSRVARVALQIGWAGVILITMLCVVDGYVRLHTFTTFSQYVCILAPHVEQQERQELLADFASMQSRADYERLMSRIQRIAEGKGLVLPPNRLYPLLGSAEPSSAASERARDEGAPYDLKAR